MNPRKKNASPALRHTLLVLWMIASLGYWMASITGLWQYTVHWDQRVQTPLTFDYDTLLVQKDGLQPEAIAAGIAAGDRIGELNGAPYSGHAQWQTILAESHPADILEIQFVRPNGATGTANLTIARAPWTHGHTSAMALFWQGFFVAGLLPLICLLIGYWVVFSRPFDRNAWLALLLLTFPSVLFLDLSLATGIALFLRVLWMQTVQLAGPPAFFLFGVYFPERSRLDARVRWIKWLLLAVWAIAVAGLVPVIVAEYYFGGAGTLLARTGNDSGAVVNFLNLSFVVLFFILLLDKLRSASTADARRRLRVLTVGISLGVGALLIVVLLPHFGIQGQNPRYFWLEYLAAIVFMSAPLTLAYVVVVQRALDVRVLLRIGTRYALAKATLWILQFALLAVIAFRLVLPLLQNRQPSPSDIGWSLAFLGLVIAFRLGISRYVQNWLDRRFFREAYNTELLMNELSDEVRRFTETQPLLETVARCIRETLHIDQIAVLLRRGNDFYLAEAFGVSGDGTVALSAQASSVRYLLNSSEPARLYRNDPDAWYLMAGTAERRTFDVLNTELLLPLLGRNRLMGVVSLGPKRSESAWSRTDLQMLQTVARQTGLALEVSELAHSLAAEAAQRERVNREMEIAREVQERLFPQQMPAVLGGSIAGACRAALGVGGDYYDVIDFGDGRIGLAVGDVSGKGISAALLMASLRASLRGVTLDSPRDFARLMHKVNRLVYEASASNRYATFFFAAFDPATRKLECVNAGHNPPVLLRNGRVIRLEADGPVVGLLPFAPYTEQTLTLEPGDLLLLYTDGISEAMTTEDEEWGEERMIAAATAVCKLPAQEIMHALFTAADAFTAGAPQHDDMTILILKLDQSAQLMGEPSEAVLLPETQAV
jgi:sigma-B regulation protein RsbU (phosphoserine phosphatase)